jgi:hypothetical protein
MKKFLIFFILLFCINNLFSDQSNDIDKFRSSQKYFMKFRGSSSFAFFYFLGHRRGYTDYKNISLVSYKPINYTNLCDPSNIYHNDGYGRQVGSTWGGLRFGFEGSYEFIAPFGTYQKNPLMRSNSISFKTWGRFTPISILNSYSIIISPIVFLDFEMGIRIATGWSFAGLFNGMGLNNEASHQGGLHQSGLGIQVRFWFNSKFKFDVAKTLPKKYQRWTHVLLTIKPEIRYEALTNQNDNVSYQFEQDNGENMNGWYFYCEFVLGYKIPIIKDYVGADRTFIKMRNKRFNILVLSKLEIYKLRLTNYYTSPMLNGWGSDFIEVRFGGLVLFQLPHHLFLITGIEFSNDRAYTDQTIGNVFYQDRIYKDWYIYFKSIYFIFGRKF